MSSRKTKEFNYDIIQLIEGVRERPCLWDKTIENYKDKVERRLAWEEIFSILEEKYDEMSLEDRRFVEEKIQSKWINTRDAFLKTLKTKMNRPKKKYLLHNHLEFLIKNYQHENYDMTLSDDISVSFVKEEVEKQPSTSKRMKRARSLRNNEVEYESRESNDGANSMDFVPCDNSSDYKVYTSKDAESRLMNEDEAFFASLLPTVVRYSVEERLQFRMEVLAVMKKLNDQRNCQGLI